MLKNRLPEIEIPEEDPFKYDKLKRNTCANTLLSLIRMYASSGCVIALNGEWGTGKTTFIKMFMQKLKNEGGHPLYFNAWENDYVSDPLIALLAELKELSSDSSKWDKVISSGGKILTSITTSIAKSFIKNKIGIDSNVVDAGLDETEKILKEDINNFAKQKNTFTEFRRNLQSYIAEKTKEDIPVVFFVDELDRCSPSFAVLVLERIKHLFDIPNVIFVLSINKKQLGYAIQGYYGSSNIDTDNYLRRFIDIEISLPQPQSEEFCQYIFDTYTFGEIFNHKNRIVHNELRSDGEKFLRMAEALVLASNLDIRTIDKIFAHTRLALMEFDIMSYIIPDVFFLLCFLKIANADLYQNIIEEKYTAQQLLNEVEDYLPSKLLEVDNNSSTNRQMTYTIASFIIMYSLNDGGRERENIITPNNDTKCILQTKHLDKKIFDDAIYWYYEKVGFGIIPLSHLIRKIELQQGLLEQNNL